MGFTERCFAVLVLLAIAVLATGHGLLAKADEQLAASEAAHSGEADLDADERAEQVHPTRP